MNTRRTIKNGRHTGTESLQICSLSSEQPGQNGTSFSPKRLQQKVSCLKPSHCEQAVHAAGHTNTLIWRKRAPDLDQGGELRLTFGFRCMPMQGEPARPSTNLTETPDSFPKLHPCAPLPIQSQLSCIILRTVSIPGPLSSFIEYT